jgi:membrane-associated phospholipid phosphatase
MLYAFSTPQCPRGFIRRRIFLAALPFNLGLVQLLADHRNIFLTKLALAAAFVGSSQGYILLILLFYVAWNKRLAFRLTVVLLAALSLDDLLKMLLRNPRPFVTQGTYMKKWAVSPSSARSLAMEYSTPSGHATGAASFYAYFYGVVRSRTARVLASRAPISECTIARTFSAAGLSEWLLPCFHCDTPMPPPPRGAASPTRCKLLSLCPPAWPFGCSPFSLMDTALKVSRTPSSATADS